MRKRLLFGCLLLAAGNVLAAKQETPAMPLAQQLPVDIVLAQQELAVEVPPSNTGSTTGAQFGLIGALIGAAVDASMEKKHVAAAEAGVADMRNLLLDYPFNQRMEAALRAKLQSEGLSPAPVITTCNAPSAVKATTSGGCSADAGTGILVLTPTYSIENTFRRLSVKMTAQYINRIAKNGDKTDLRMRFGYSYEFSFPLQAPRGDEPAVYAATWTGMGKERLAALLDEGVAQISDMLAYDFSTEGRAERLTRKKGSTVLNGVALEGQKVRDGQDWVWTRMSKHHGDALRGYRPLTPDAAQVPADTTAAPIESPSEAAMPAPATSP